MPAKTYEQKFSDVPQSHWAFGYIAELVNDNVLSGYPDGKFYPSNNVTRAEFAKIMISASGVKVNPATSTSFSDVAVTDWYCPYIESAKEFLTGYNYSGSAMYLPNKAAIREDIAVALVKLKGYDVSVADLGMIQTMFSDYDSISETAKRYVAVAVARGLVSGYDDGTFKGQQSITRAEAATLIWRANQYGADNKILGSETETVTTSDTTTTQNQTTVTEEKKTENKVQEEKKPYVINKLASANVKDSALMTMDNDNNIYYIESDDNCVYKLDTSSGKKTKFFDINKLSLQKTEKQDVVVEEEVTETVETGEYDEVEEEITETVTDEETGEETEVTKTVTKQVPKTKEVTKTVTKTVSKDVVVEDYYDFEPYQLKYDTGIDKLILCGKYTTLEKPYKSPTSTKYGLIYDITGKSGNVFYEREDSVYCYGAALNSEIAHIFISTYFDNLNMSNGNVTVGSNPSYYGLREPIKMMFKIGNNIYALGFHGGYSSSSGALFKYDFASSDYKSIAGTDYFNSVAQKGSNLYFWYNDEFRKMSVSDGKVTELDINTKSDNVEFADMGSMNKISEVFFVIDDNKVMFYDEAMQAFRVLQKNK